jgi:hypothetical protein
MKECVAANAGTVRAKIRSNTRSIDEGVFQARSVFYRVEEVAGVEEVLLVVSCLMERKNRKGRHI